MKILTAVMIIMLFSLPLWAQTEVEGEVSGVWDAEGSPYILVGDASVPEGESLTLEPGVHMRIIPDTRFIVHGAFFANGTEDYSIYIKREGVVGLPNVFIFEEDASDTSTISYTRFDSAYVRFQGNAPVINNCRFHCLSLYYQECNRIQFTENSCDNPLDLGFLSIHMSECSNITLLNNRYTHSISIWGFGNLEMTDNELDPGGVWLNDGSNVSIENLHLGGFESSLVDDVHATGIWSERSISFNISRGIDIEQCYGFLILDATTDATIQNCTDAKISISSRATQLTVRNNLIDHIDLRGGEFEVFENDVDIMRVSPENAVDAQGNTIQKLRIQSSDCVFSNNTISEIETDGGSDSGTVFSNNRILNEIHITNGGPFFYRNDIGIWNNDTGVNFIGIISTIGHPPLFVNNTFHEQENSRLGRPLVTIYSGEAIFYNNLFLGDFAGSME